MDDIFKQKTAEILKTLQEKCGLPKEEVDSSLMNVVIAGSLHNLFASWKYWKSTPADVIDQCKNPSILQKTWLSHILRSTIKQYDAWVKYAQYEDQIYTAVLLVISITDITDITKLLTTITDNHLTKIKDLMQYVNPS